MFNQYSISLPETLEMNPSSGEILFKLQNNMFIYARLFSCENVDTDELIDLIDKSIEEKNNIVYAVIPENIIPPITVCATGIIYYWDIVLKKAQKIRIKKKPLLLLSIIYAKKQLIEIIRLIKEFRNKRSYVLFSCMCQDHQSCHNNIILEKTCSKVAWPTNIDYSILASIYNVDTKSFKTKIDLEKKIISKISEFIARTYY
ncbi:hypothetical protein J4526_01675 [Desulfurococcaceae archaeon MEX13E-LK6-19]|nr:hypothetical protein J4526_01675 [Desulfurococcaceae archaeon MEX13E-LK6-19]